MVSPLDRLGRKGRIAVKVVGYFFLALFTFIFALQATFPYGRVKDRVISELSAKYETKIGSYERGIIPGRLTLNDITLRTRPAKAGEVPTTFFIKSLDLDVGFLPFLDGTAEVDFEAVIGSGTVAGTIGLSKTKTEAHVKGTNLESKLLPMREAIGLPMAGVVTFSADLLLPKEQNKQGKLLPNWTKADGAFAFACPKGCIIGDGQTKLKAKLSNARSQAFAGDGIEFGKVFIQALAAQVDIKKGVMSLSKLETKSEDGELHAELSIQLAPALDDSDVAGCLRFVGTKALLEREPKTYTAITATGAPMGPDNLYHIKLDGKFREIKRRGILCGPGISDQNMDDMSGGNHAGGGNSRPSITVQGDGPLSPDAGTATGSATPETNPPPPEQVDAGVAADAPVATPPSGPVDENNQKQNQQPENGFQPGTQPMNGEQPPPSGEQPANPPVEGQVPPNGEAPVQEPTGENR